MEKIKDEISWPDVDILFAPHHGRDSGKIPKAILQQMDPKIVVIGEAPSKNLNYYGEYNTITQNSAGAIYFECLDNCVNIYVGSPTYSVDFLEDKGASTYSELHRITGCVIVFGEAYQGCGGRRACRIS